MHRKRRLSQSPVEPNQGDTERPSEAKLRCVRTETLAGSSLALRNPLINVLAGLNNMRKDNVLCDWIIKTNDNKEIPVHSVVLTISSSYFQQLHLEPLEGDLRRRVIPLDIPKTVLQEILDYSYTGKCKLDQENFPDILIAANQYEFPEVIQECYKCVMNQLLPENCISIYQFAKEYFTEQLSSNLLLYICHNFRKVLLKNPDILELTIEEVISILSSDELNVADESSLFLFAVRWIEHDMNEREQHVHNLFKCIRFGLIDQTFMSSTVMTNPLVVRNRPTLLEYLNMGLRLIFNTFLNLPTEEHRYSNDIVFVFGGRITNTNNFTVVEVFDRCALKWFLVKLNFTSYVNEYCCYGICALSKLVYLVGGSSKGDIEGTMPTSRVMCFDPEMKTWEEKACMHYARVGMCVVALDGFVYAIGGFNESVEDLKSAERYDPRSNQWTMIAAMNDFRTNAGAATLSGRIYVAGGVVVRKHNMNMIVTILDTVEVYDPVTDQWTFVQPLWSPRCCHSLVNYQDELYAIGGNDELTPNVDDPYISSNTVERYVLNDAPHWVSVNSMASARERFVAVVLDDKILVIGGSKRLPICPFIEISESSTEFYDSATGLWTPGPQLLHLERGGLAACVVSGLQNAKEYSYSTFCATARRLRKA